MHATTPIRNVPCDIQYPAELPISEKAPELEALLKQHQIIVVAGETGSGKTTQLPKVCLNAGFGRHGIIGHTQPRRLAAVSVANRIAEELGVAIGDGVGYQIRFDDKTSDKCFLKLMTDGILLAEIQHDRNLKKYDVIIIDEAHERSLNIDFLLGFLKQLCKRRKELKLIVTSATIDVEKFSKYFDGAPITTVSGRTFPVETHYLEPEILAEKNALDDDPIINGVLNALNDIVHTDRRDKTISGDVLVFLSSEREIRECALKIRKLDFSHTEVLPLYARLRKSEQTRIFQSHKGRRIVLSTNVAETSITVPGIRYVVDSGFARISRYSVHSKVQRLPIEAISQASAKQRLGRCGRVANGVCIRLYSEEDFSGRPLFTDPEIKRTNLASVILQMLALGLGKIESFPFIEAPEQRAINDGVKLLLELNAIDSQRRLTRIGKLMARFPVDPRHGRMLVASKEQGCLNELLIIVSALCVQDPRENPAEKRQQAQAALAVFNHPESDFLGFVNLWNLYEEKRQSLSQSKLRKYCGENFLSYMRMREWREVHHQLLKSCQQLKLSINRDEADYTAIHRSIIAGSLNQIATFSDTRQYLSSRNRKFSLFSNSVLSKKSTKWIVSGELIETSQIYASLAAKIQPEWVVGMSLHLVKRTHFEPHWSKKRQQVMAYEKIVLFGITLLERQLVPFSRIDPATSRDIFLEEALLAFQLQTRHRFYNHNKQFLVDLRKQEEKLRRPEFIWSDSDLSHFYNTLLPQDISSGQQFNKWLDEAGQATQESFRLSHGNLKEHESLSDRGQTHPDQLYLQGNSFTIDYNFKPGEERDGAVVKVPIQVLLQLTQADVDWVVPGILREKVIALLKSLPKALRKKCIPVSDFADKLLPMMSKDDGSFIESLCKQVHLLRGITLNEGDFDYSQLSEHLKVKVQVTDEQAKELAFSDDLGHLKKQLHNRIDDGATKVAPSETAASPRAAVLSHPLLQTGLKDWSFGDLPERVQLGDELKLQRYPALVDQQDSVSIELRADATVARMLSESGVIRLYRLRSVQQNNAIKKQFSRLETNLLLKTTELPLNIANDACAAIYRTAFEANKILPHSKEGFDGMLMQHKGHLLSVADRYETLLRQLIDDQFRIKRNMNKINPSLSYMREDIAEQMRALIYPGFLSEIGFEWLKHYPRYLKAIAYRLSKLPHPGDKDRQHASSMSAKWQEYQKFKDGFDASGKPGKAQALLEYRFLLEEFRVSLFAQQLKTAIPVSEKRLKKQWDKFTL